MNVLPRGCLHSNHKVRGYCDRAARDRPLQSRTNYDVVVVGAGVFGAWIALDLRRRGRRVLLIDAYGPGNTRASSGGETRVIRMGYGADEIYTAVVAAIARRSGRSSPAATGERLFRETGVLWLARERGPARARARSRRCAGSGVPHERLERAELEQRWPQIDFGADHLGDPRAGERRADGAPRRAGGGAPGAWPRASSSGIGGRAARAAGRPPRVGRRVGRGTRSRAATFVFALRAVARQALPRSARRPDLPDPAGGLLLRPAAGRRALRAAGDAGVDRLRRRDLRHPRPRGQGLQGRARPPRRARSIPTRGERVADRRRRSRRRAQYLAERFPALAGRAARRERGLPVREHVERRLPDRPPPRASRTSGSWAAARATASSTAPRSASYVAARVDDGGAAGRAIQPGHEGAACSSGRSSDARRRDRAPSPRARAPRSACAQDPAPPAPRRTSFQAAVNASVERGVTWLRAKQQKDGNWKHGQSAALSHGRDGARDARPPSLRRAPERCRDRRRRSRRSSTCRSTRPTAPASC